jgi:hypothetical protein
MTTFLIHKNKEEILASTVIDNKLYTVDADNLLGKKFNTINGSSFQKKLPFLSSRLDINEMVLSFGMEIEPGLDFLEPHVKANLLCGIGLDKCPMHKIEGPFKRWVQEKLKFIDNNIQYDETDVDFAIKILNAKKRIISSFGEFYYQDTIHKVNWSKYTTKTGRMRVQDPIFNPLILKKTDRHLVKPIHEDHKLYFCDFKALEFRLALKRFNSEFALSKDPYTDIARHIELDSEDRDEFKVALISTMYGSSLKNSKLSDSDKVKVIKWVLENMDFDSLAKDLKEQCDKFGYFKNSFGRRVYEDSDVTNKVLINNIFQSDGADFVYQSYDNLLQEIKNIDIDCYPIFMIHDAIVFSCRKSDYYNLRNISNINNFPIEWKPFV